MTDADVILHRANLLVQQARRHGLVLTIEQRPLQPPAMGHYQTVVGVRRARVRAEPRQAFDLDELCKQAMARVSAAIDESAEEAQDALAVGGLLTRWSMEERHHGPRGVGGSGAGLGVSFQPVPGQQYMITVGGGGGGAGSGGVSARGVGPLGYGFFCAMCGQNNQHLRGCSNVMPGEPVVGGPL